MQPDDHSDNHLGHLPYHTRFMSPIVWAAIVSDLQGWLWDGESHASQLLIHVSHFETLKSTSAAVRGL